MTENKLPQKPDNAVWNASENEWELGEKNSQGQYVGEWMWWLAPTNHLCCHSFFDDKGNMLSAKRFHPNGEISRELDEAKNLDVYYRSTAPTSENFAYGYNTDERAWKAIKRLGYPVSFDLYDKNNNLLNPELKPAELKILSPNINTKEILRQINKGSKKFSKGELDENFVQTVIDLVGEVGETTPLLEAELENMLEDELEIIYHEGDLEIDDLSDWDAMDLACLVVNGNLTVKNAIWITEDPSTLLVVNGNLKAKNISTGGGLVVTGNLEVENCLFGDYNHGSAYIRGDLTSRFFFPEEYFFEAHGKISIDIALGNAYRLNDNQNPELLNYNYKTVREFFNTLDNQLLSQIDLTNEAYLDNLCEDDGVWEYVDWRSFMRFAMTGQKIFKY